MRSRFELDPIRDGEPLNRESTQHRYVASESIDPESCDASERHFAISLDKTIGDSARFVVEEPDSCGRSSSDSMSDGGKETPFVIDRVPNCGDRLSSLGHSQGEFVEFSGSQLKKAELEQEKSWRREVSARLSKYQARRRIREPRYPSLQLKFETQEPWRGSSPAADLRGTDSIAASASNGAVLAKNTARNPELREIPPLAPAQSIDLGARVIEFPRCSAAAISHSDELAEPVFDRPRIMEAPEIIPANPALGGILIEPCETPANEKRPGFEMPLQAARMATRLAATLIDALIVLVGLALFAYIFWQVTALIPPIRFTASLAISVGGILWASYQYLLMVHCGTTPGLKLAKLKVSDFDGSAVPRRMRRWRVIASMLSGLSLGLGYAWCFLDEDQLCWHDRITRTCIVPTAQS